MDYYDECVPAIDLLRLERPLLESGAVVVGIDEVGRGALAGPLMVGAVVLSHLANPPEGLADSKALTPAKRSFLSPLIYAWAADVAIGEVSSAEIDAWGLRLALAVATDRALEALEIPPTMALIDGPLNLLRPPRTLSFATPPPPIQWENLPVIPVVKGDATCASIAGAAIVAKVERDRRMVELDPDAPEYQWRSNKGYGSPSHLRALAQHGPSQWHRQTWALPTNRQSSGGTDVRE